MGSITAIKRHPGEQTLINNMSAELQAILARVKTVEQQSAYLAEQISIHAERQIFMASALQESQAVAAEICSGAEQRIDSVTARARSMIEPQQARIIELNREIAGLEKEIPDQPPLAPANGIPTDLQIVPLSSHLDNIIELSAYTDPLPGWEEVEITAVAAVESETDSAENTPAVIAEVAVEAEVPTPVSLAPPSSPNPASDHVSTPLDEDDGERQSVSNDENRSQPPLHHSDAAAAEIMNFDAGINVWHIHATKSWHRPNHQHHWQLQLKVEVPEENIDAVYIHVLATVTSALAPFDEAVLNQVFPFDLIEPSDNNVAHYFFNLLEDTLRMQGLILKELILLEDDTPLITVNTHNTDIDEMLKGEDLIQDIRSILFDKSKNGGVPVDRPAKKRFGYFRRN